MGKIAAAAAAAASVLLLGTGASATVFVVGKSLAASCSTAAKSGARDPASLQLCSRALNQEALAGRNLAGTYVNRGVISLRRGDIRSAMLDFQDAVAAEPRLGEAFVNRGLVHIAEGRYREGLEDTDRGLALGIDEPERAYYNRAMAREWLDDEKGAYLDYRRAAELNPEWDLPRQQLARFTVISNPRR